MADLKAIINEMKEEPGKQLAEWIAIPSVKGESAPNAPFGVEVRRMLDKALSDARAMGFETRDFDGYAGDVRMGPIGVNPLAILAHLDVVPAGDGWHTDPFTATVDGNMMYGRGTEDDKGPAIAALYAMLAVAKSGLPLKREVRLILGCDEECGWGCMDYYTAHCDMPKTGFSPDASYPVINTEKGILHLKLHSAPCDEGLRVLEMHVGDRANVIPGSASAKVAGDEALCEAIASKAAELQMDVKARYVGEGVVEVLSTGIPGHAAFPWGAKNALGQLLTVLDPMGLKGGLHILATVVGMQYDGSSLMIKCSDEISGELTCNMGVLRYDPEKGLDAMLDIRYPLLANPDGLMAGVRAALTECFTVESDHHQVPHHVASNSKLVQGLLDAYGEVTGLKKECIAIGGGTYARVLEEGVAFGAVFTDEEERAHQADERVNLDSLTKNIEIYAKAILNLQNA